jgi:ribosomal protein L32
MVLPHRACPVCGYYKKRKYEAAITAPTANE